MPGSAPATSPLFAPGSNSLGTVYPGGSFQIVANTLASPTVVSTLAAHGLATGDTIFWTASTTSVPLLTATPQTVVTVLTATTFSLNGINCSTAGTAGAFDIAITSTPTTPGAAPLVNCGSAHGLRVGDTVTITASGSTPSLDGAQVVTGVPSPTSFNVLTSAVPTTVAGSTTAAHFSKTIFYSDTWSSGDASYFIGVAIKSVVGTAPVTTLVDIQGSLDGLAWFNAPYATVAAPQTLAVAQLTVTTAVTTSYKIAGPGEANFFPFKFLRLKFTSSTNIVMQCNLLAMRAP